MALELLVERIRADAEREVKAIAQEAESKASAIENETRTRSETMFRRELEALRARLQFTARQEYSQREIEIRRSLLQEREILLNDVRRAWASRLAAASPSQEAALLRKMIERARQTISTGTLAASPRTLELLGTIAGFVAHADDALAGGLRLIGGDGRVVADLSTEAVLGEFWARQRPAVAGELFGAAMTIGGKG